MNTILLKTLCWYTVAALPIIFGLVEADWRYLALLPMSFMVAWINVRDDFPRVVEKLYPGAKSWAKRAVAASFGASLLITGAAAFLIAALLAIFILVAPLDSLPGNNWGLDDPTAPIPELLVHAPSVTGG